MSQLLAQAAIHRVSPEWLHVVPRDGKLTLPFDLEQCSGVANRDTHVQIPQTALNAPAVRAWLGEQVAAKYAARASFDRSLPQSLRALFKHQEGAARLAISRGCQLLCDEPGLGKTTTAATIAEHYRSATLRPVVIIAPRYVEDTWRGELLALGYISHEDEFLALRGKHGDVKRLNKPIVGVRYIFVHYEIVASWWPWIGLCRPCASIVDEAHLAKNPKSLRHKAAQLATGGTSCRVVLTGTPILNRIGELHTLLSLTTGQWTWGSQTAFRIRYAGAYNDGYGYVDSTPSHSDELRARLEGVYVRRTLTDSGVELPPITRATIRVEFDEKSSEEYRGALKGYSPRDIALAIKRRAGSSQTIEWLTKLRKIASRAKLPTTVDHVNSLLEQGEDVVVFTWERAMSERIARAVGLEASLVIHGDIPQDERQQRIALFQSSVRTVPRALIATYGALSMGVTLTRARQIVMHDLDYVPATMIQAEHRVYRISQTRQVNSVWMIAKDSIDDVIARLATTKAATIAMSTGDDEPQQLADLLDTVDESQIEESLENALRWAGLS